MYLDTTDGAYRTRSKQVCVVTDCACASIFCDLLNSHLNDLTYSQLPIFRNFCVFEWEECSKVWKADVQLVSMILDTFYSSCKRLSGT